MSSKGHKRRLWIRYWDKIGVWTGSVVRVLHRLGRLLLKERVWQICKHSVEVLRTIEMCCSKDLVVKNVGKLFTSVCSEKDFWRSEDQGRNWLSWVELINLWLLEKWKKSYWRAVALQSPRLSLFEGEIWSQLMSSRKTQKQNSVSVMELEFGRSPLSAGSIL